MIMSLEEEEDPLLPDPLSYLGFFVSAKSVPSFELIMLFVEELFRSMIHRKIDWFIRSITELVVSER